MKRIDIAVPVTALRDDELTETDRVLVMKAREATYRAYAPYSKFHVGAAILLDNGEIVTGSNQENAATPSSLRNAQRHITHTPPIPTQSSRL